MDLSLYHILHKEIRFDANGAELILPSVKVLQPPSHLSLQLMIDIYIQLSLYAASGSHYWKNAGLKVPLERIG